MGIGGGMCEYCAIWRWPIGWEDEGLIGEEMLNGDWDG